MSSAFLPIAEVAVETGALVYEHGWQSWSPSTWYPVAATSARAANMRGRQEMGYRPGKPAPPRGFQGEGLLAVAPGPGAPVKIWWAPDPDREVASIRAHLEGDKLVILADGEVRNSTFKGALDVALSAWAADFANLRKVRTIRSIGPGWCSWYQYFGKVTEVDILENLAAIDKFGLEVQTVQIDDGYEAEVGDWLERSPGFPHPLSELASRIRSTGRHAGIWIAPMVVAARSQIASQHSDWLVGDASAGYGWYQDLAVLDITNPDASQYLEHVLQSFHDWGFSYFKVDFMYAGAIDGRRHGDCNGLTAYIEAIKLIRRSIGKNSILLGCGAPILPSIGRFDAMRVSPDVGINYDPLLGDLSMPSQRSALLSGRGRAFQHARFWVNDPDCLIVRSQVERREEWASHISAHGGLRTSSDRLNLLDDWGLEVSRQLLKPSPRKPFFELL